MKASQAIAVVALAATVVIGTVSARQATRPGSPVTLFALPLKLPAVGNLGAVREWHFGRLQSVEQAGASPDIHLDIRTPDGAVHRIVGPRVHLAELARASGWVTSDRVRPVRQDYVERMIAFDADRQQRLIAMISLEPMNRDRNRLRRALGTR